MQELIIILFFRWSGETQNLVIKTFVYDLFIY